MCIRDSAGTDTNSFGGISRAADGVTATISDEGTGTAEHGSFESDITVQENFNSIENLLGSGGDDVLTGNNLDNVIVGGRGNDTILGLGGDDLLFGESKASGFGINQTSQPLTSLTTSQSAADLVSEAVAGNLYFNVNTCLLYTSPSPRDATLSRMPSSA